MRGAPPPTTDQPPLSSYANRHLFIMQMLIATSPWRPNQLSYATSKLVSRPLTSLKSIDRRGAALQVPRMQRRCTPNKPEGVCVYQDSLLNIHDILRYHFLGATIVITIILAGCKPLCRFWSSADQGNALSLPFT